MAGRSRELALRIGALDRKSGRASRRFCALRRYFGLRRTMEKIIGGAASRPAGSCRYFGGTAEILLYLQSGVGRQLAGAALRAAFGPGPSRSVRPSIHSSVARRSGLGDD